MAHAYHELFYHFVWATHAREPHVARSLRPQLLAILSDEAKRHGGVPLRHNAMPDHVHLLARLPPTVLVADFVGKVKGATAHAVNHDLKPQFKLRWQEGYGVVTVRRGDLERVGRYIDRQEEHHRTGRVSTVLERIEVEDDGTLRP